MKGGVKDQSPALRPLPQLRYAPAGRVYKAGYGCEIKIAGLF